MNALHNDGESPLEVGVGSEDLDFLKIVSEDWFDCRLRPSVPVQNQTYL